MIYWLVLFFIDFWLASPVPSSDYYVLPLTEGAPLIGDEETEVTAGVPCGPVPLDSNQQCVIHSADCQLSEGIVTHSARAVWSTVLSSVWSS